MPSNEAKTTSNGAMSTLHLPVLMYFLFKQEVGAEHIKKLYFII